MKLNKDDATPYLDGWPLSKSRYSKWLRWNIVVIFLLLVKLLNVCVAQ